MDVEFIEEKRNQSHMSNYYCGEIDHIDTYALFKGRKLHIRGRAIGKSVPDYKIRFGEEDIEKLKEHFIKSGGRWICFYCPSGILGTNPNWADPFEFLDFVKENKYTFNEFLRLEKYKDHWEFGGNLHQISHAFCFRIYDKETAMEIKGILKKSGYSKSIGGNN